MQANTFKVQPLSSDAVGHRVVDPQGALGNSAAAMVIELGIGFAQSELGADMSGTCSCCGCERDSQAFAAEIQNAFCSETCEEEFIRAALDGISLEKSIRMLARLESLLDGAQSRIQAARNGSGA